MSTPNFILLCVVWAVGWVVLIGGAGWAAIHFGITRPSNQRTAAHRARMAQMTADAEKAKQRDLADFDRFCDGVRADMDRNLAEAIRRYGR